MKKNIKKIVSVCVASSMLLSLAGCADKAPEMVADQADSFVSAVTGMNAKKIKGACSEDLDDDDAEIIDNYCGYASNDDINYDSYVVMAAVADTLSAEIDEDSIEASTKKGEGSADVVFTIADYESIVADEDLMVDENTAVSAIEDADTKEIEVTVEFELEDGEWVVSNAVDVISEVYAFVDDIDVSFVPPFTFDNLRWYYTDDGDFDVDSGDTSAVYTNESYCLDVDMILPSDVDYSELYYEYTFEGQVVYTSSNGTRMGYLYASDCGSVELVDGYFPAGVYTCTFYLDGEEVATASCTVVLDVATTTAPSPEPSDIDINAELAALSVGDVVYLENTSDFYANTSDCVWYDVAGDGVVSDGRYASGTTAIQFTCMADADCGDIGFIYCYSADGNYANSEIVTNDIGNLVSYGNGDFYEFDLTGCQAGTYWIVVCDSNFNVPYVIGMCQVG